MKREIITGFCLLMMAVALSSFEAFSHGVFGGRMYPNNIKNSDLEPLGKSLSLFSWPMLTIFLFVGVVALASLID